MDRLRREKALLISLAIHALMLSILLSMTSIRIMSPPESGLDVTPERTVRMVVPPAEVLRQMLGQQKPRPRIPPQPQPRPQAQAKERISIGPPSSARARVLVLERDRDLPPAPPGDGSGRTTGRRAGAGDSKRSSLPRLADGTRNGEIDSALRIPGRTRSASNGQAEHSIAASFRRWQQNLGSGDWTGGGGGARQIGPLFFDPAGADFTAWINYFKNEVYRNWIVPQAALMGLKGRVDLRFTVGRDGRLIELRLIQSSGTEFLDRAASNALIGGRFLALPRDYRPESVTMNVSFFYNEEPRPS